jgi:signal transduction histidine kinase
MHFRTLTARFGTLYAFILLIVAGVCAVVWGQLIEIRADSSRVMEETRELEVLGLVRAGLAAAQECRDDPKCTGEEEVKRLRQLIAPTMIELKGLGDHEGDPSSKEHQATEGDLLRDLVKNISRLGEILTTNEGQLAANSFSEILDAAAHAVDVIHRETLDEARQADLDLEKRAGNMQLVMLVTAIGALALLGAALMAVHISVVRPLHVLREGAERYGRGELGHRIRVRNRDELSALAQALNGMAASISDAQEHLEERVRKRTSEFIRAARLADLGILASGVAHEVNTPLASIAACAEGLERRLNSGDLSPSLLEDYAETIAREVYRARAITTRMLALVRQERGTMDQVSLQIILDQARSALGYKAEHEHVKLAVSKLQEDILLHADGGELVQILVNLLSNAIDASPRGGEVILRATYDSRSIHLTVEDQGPGIPVKHMERILEPFFTTKAPDVGTGLGLALVNNLVESHMGKLSVGNSPEGGARFKVSLPRDWRITP